MGARTGARTRPVYAHRTLCESAGSGGRPEPSDAPSAHAEEGGPDASREAPTGARGGRAPSVPRRRVPGFGRPGEPPRILGSRRSSVAPGGRARHTTRGDVGPRRRVARGRDDRLPRSRRSAPAPSADPPGSRVLLPQRDRSFRGADAPAVRSVPMGVLRVRLLHGGRRGEGASRGRLPADRPDGGRRNRGLPGTPYHNRPAGTAHLADPPRARGACGSESGRARNGARLRGRRRPRAGHPTAALPRPTPRIL